MLPPGKFQAAAWTGLIGLLLLLTSGCGDSNDPGGGGDLVSQQIGPAGGTVRSSDGRLTLIFPADAVTQTQTITIEPLQISEVGSEFSAFSVEHAYRLGPDGLAFQKAITASVPSAPPVTQPAGTHELSMALLLTSANAAAGALDSVRVEQVDGAMVLRGELSHFSTLVETRPHVTVTIEGIPTEMAVNTNFIAQVTAVGDVLELETVGYIDASVAPIRSLDTPGSEAAHLDKVGPNTFAGSFVYTCDAAGRGAYRVTGDIRFTAASLPLIPHFYLLFYPAPIT